MQALQQQLAAAQRATATCTLTLAAKRQVVAERDAAIAALNRVIAKQHLQFDELFGGLETLE